jgi:hypothetical protein
LIWVFRVEDGFGREQEEGSSEEGGGGCKERRKGSHFVVEIGIGFGG